MVVKPARKQHHGGHHQRPHRRPKELELMGKALAAPHLEEARGDLNAVEAAPQISVQNLLADEGPDDLSTGLEVNRIGHPSGKVRKPSAMKIHAAEPDEDNGQMPKVS